MCSIVGLQGNVKADDIVKMLKVSKNRGPDSSGIFLDKIHTNMIWLNSAMIIPIRLLLAIICFPFMI